MYQSIDLFKTASAMASHAGNRQAIVATNIANADTPGYRAKAIAPFADVYSDAPHTQMRQTRTGHVAAAAFGVTARAKIDMQAEPAPNGNTVSLEEEMLNSVEVTREHSRALAIYRHAMTVIRTSLGR